jgi:hypothetical protein
MWLIFVFLYIFFNLAHGKAVSGIDPKNEIYLSGCALYDGFLNQLRVLPGGYLCQVFENGSWIATDKINLKYWSNEGKLIWTLPGNYHHQIREDEDGNLLLLKEENSVFPSLSILHDVVEKRNKAGELLASWSTKDSVDALGKIHRKGKNRDLMYALFNPNSKEKYNLEFSHVNSIQVIPKDVRAKLNGAKYLIHEPIIGACLGLDGDLKNIVWSRELNDRGLEFSLKHDCQISLGGHILYFDNFGKKWNKKYSFAVYENDFNGKPVFTYPTRKSNFLHAPFAGAVEKLSPNRYLVSVTDNEFTRAIWVDGYGKVEREAKISGPRQEIKSVPWKFFLERNLVR